MTVQEAMVCLSQALRRDRLAHAYLLVGSPRGAARELTERILQLLACEADGEAPCGHCGPCRQVAGRTWADNTWLEPESKSRLITIDQIREELLPRVSQTAFAGGWKAGILVAADRLNEAAANAFLKMLEEPPARTLFLLLSDQPQVLLPTVVSRCQRFDLEEPVAELDEPWRTRVLDVLAGPPIKGPLAAMAAGGRLTDVLAELQAAASDEVRREAVAEEESAGLDEEKDVLAARVSARYRERRALLLLAMQRWYRDLLVLRAGGAEELVHYRDRLDVLRARARHVTLAQALANVDGLDALMRQLERNLNETSLFAYWMDRLRDGAA